MSSNVIAIDGPAASGKSTVAGLIAARLGIAYISTGSLYRAVALACRRANLGFDDVPKAFLETLFLKYLPGKSGAFEITLNGEFPGEALRGAEIAAGASRVATQPVVRTHLLEVQRSFAGEKWIVMEGRDIGTVIFPDARCKFFVTATAEERARRRLAQSGEGLAGQTLAEVARAIAERDAQDANRPVAPLKPAPDAELIDTTGLTIEEVVELILSRVKAVEAER